MEESGMTEWDGGEGGELLKDKENDLNLSLPLQAGDNQFSSLSPNDSSRVIQPHGAVKGEAVLLSGMGGNMSMLQPLGASIPENVNPMSSPSGQSRARAVLAKASSSSKGQFWGQS